MRDIFYNQTYKIGSHDWLIRFTEAEKSEWDWIQFKKKRIAVL